MRKNQLKWEKPKLIVLVRRESQEQVLSACKVSGISGSGTSEYDCDVNCASPCEELSMS